MIDNNRLKQTFLDMVKIASPTREERGVADYVSQVLIALGATVQEDNLAEIIGGNSGNIIAHIKGTRPYAPRILLSAHMDTVTPCEGICPIEENGVIRTDGTTILGGDDKAGVAAILEALRTVREQKLPCGDIEVIFTVAEEGGLLGSKHLDPAEITADMGFVFDSSGEPGIVIVQAPAENSITIAIHGKKSHAGLAPELGINAITLASQAIVAAKQGRIDEETTANIGTIAGGVATNIVPDLVTLRAEVRSLDEQKLSHATDELLAPFIKLGDKADITVTRGYDAYCLAESCAVVDTVKRACGRIGLTATLKATGGGSDGNNFNRHGLDTVVLGIGMTNVHTTAETLRIADLENSARLALAIIEEAAQISK